MREVICELICSLCGRAINQNMFGNYSCNCEDNYRKQQFPDRISVYKKDITNIGCPVCLSSQLVLPKKKEIYKISSPRICRNPECSLYHLDYTEENMLFLFYGDLPVCRILRPNSTILAITNYEGISIASLFIKEVVRRLLDRK